MSAYDETKAKIAKLESRIRQQRHVITDLQGKRAAQNARFTGWHEGREAILREQLREATSAMYAWKAAHDKLAGRGEQT